jgi:metallophosphoesterase superfamily enzyme
LRLGIEVVDEPFALDGLRLCHHPRPVSGAYVLGGHLHPCVKLLGRARDRMRLPCFWFGPTVGVLPAFGAFTGMHPIPAGARRTRLRDRGRRGLRAAARRRLALRGVTGPATGRR